jgi:uncharacterized membrane protein YhiD involved in acid resistance
MFELFPDGPVYEYSQFINITYSFIWAFLLASIVAITHRLTFTGNSYPKNFFQSLILGAVVTTMVMMAIGDSLARGLGVFGAMAIIRFRTRIDDPRDVLFLFAALSTGLAIGVYGYTISFVGTILFCAVAFLLHASPFKNYVRQYLLSFSIDDAVKLELVNSILKLHCRDFKQTSVVINKKNIIQYKIEVSLKNDSATEELISELRKIEGIMQIELTLNTIQNT